MPLKVVFYNTTYASRTELGFRIEEFKHLDTEFIGKSESRALEVYNKRPTWNHLFCAYQRQFSYTQVLALASKNGAKVAVASESPCLMVPFPKSWFKWMYLRTAVNRRVREAVQHAPFFLNFSGDDTRLLWILGWDRSKIIPCGYFPPPLPNSQFVKRSAKNNKPFTVLMTGKHDYHRDPMTLLHAAKLLKASGVKVHIDITQSGPLTPRLQNYARKNSLDVSFHGFVDINSLNRLYEECSCFVASGRSEPWGMRVNDALNCGAPLIVGSGMGAARIVKMFQCGLVFASEDHHSLAAALTQLATSQRLYQSCADNVVIAKQACDPIAMGKSVSAQISELFPEWT